MKETPEEPSVYKNDSLHTHLLHLISRGSLLLDLDIMATKEKSLAQQRTPKGQSSSRCDHSANTQQHQPLPKDTRERRNHSKSCDSYFNNELVTKFLSDPRVVTENAIKLTPDEMHAIYMDIFKPLDFFEMFYERLKAQEKEKEKEELDEERIR